jgi:penicillin-binding protein 2
MNRASIITYLAVAVFAIFLLKIYNLTIKSNTYYEELAKNNITRHESLVPVRGQILDRNGLPLAVNELGFSIDVSPHLTGKAGMKRLEDINSTIMGFFPYLKDRDIIKTYKKNNSPYNHDFITVIDFIPYEDMQSIYPLLIQEDNIKITPATKRYYPNITMASHVLGYLGKANNEDVKKSKIAKLSGRIGKSGIEKQYNDYLEGELGFQKIKITAFNKELGVVEKKEPKTNNNLFLSLDTSLQKEMDKLYEGKSGAALIMDIETGDLLAAGSYPQYDANMFVDGISTKDWNKLIKDPHHPFTNKLISGLYPPGSVIKMGTGLAIIQAGIDPEDEEHCSGSFEFGNRDFRCWKKEGHGDVDLREAIKHSCDVYFYKKSLHIGVDALAKVLKSYGLGKKSGIDLPNEFYGVVPSVDWKKQKYNQSWYMGETLITSIGQGYTLTTPMQIAKYTAALASGNLVTPKLNLLQPPKITPLEPELKKGLPIIRDAMEAVCNEPGGTAYWRMRGTEEKLACKTGTAQVVGIAQDVEERMDEEDMEYFHRSHAWMTAYLPIKNPQYVITVMVEHGGHGSSACGPIIKDLSNKLVSLGYVKE